jgi:hypothetical protein
VFLRQFRHWIWQRDPTAHNDLLPRFIAGASTHDAAIALGDYSCDLAGIGLADDDAHASAQACLQSLRSAFGDRLHLTLGDHELGKKMLGANAGGLRLASYERATRDLGIPPVWRREVGPHVLLGITSTLWAMPIYLAEALPDERAAWLELAEAHRTAVRAEFARLQPRQRVILFCHDPTALPFLRQDEVIRSRLGQVALTLIGHLHSPLILRLAEKLAGLPPVRGLGHTPRRLTTALRQARDWKPFHVRLCPSPSGMQLLKDGGWLSLELDSDTIRTVFHPLPWPPPPASSRGAGPRA